MDIPKDFDSKWELSDVILLTEDADGNKKELHASKNYLATYSSVFRSMFFSSFSEANSDKVNVSCSYEMMKLILQIIYEQSRDFFNVNQVREASDLAELYKATDYLDIPAIRKMCIHQMLGQPNIVMATAVLKVVSVGDALHDTLMEILQKMSNEDVDKFFSIADQQRVFSKKDVKALYRIKTATIFPVPKNTFTQWTALRNIPDLSTSVKSPLIDSTQKWPRSDVLLRTKNSERKKLYSNKTVLSMVSPHFSEMFFDSKIPTNSTEFSEIEVDVDYLVMKNILSIIHHSYSDGNLAKFISRNLFLLFHMYRAAAEDNMDIPLIRDLCFKALHETSERFNLEVAVALNVNERSKLLGNMNAEETIQWIYDCSDVVSPAFFSIFDNKKFKAEFSSKTKATLSLNEVGIIIGKLTKKHNSTTNS